MSPPTSASGVATLHVFTADAEEWVVASTTLDARDVYAAHIGAEPSEDDPGGCDFGLHVSHWEQLDDGKPMTIRLECQETHRERSCPKCVDGIIRETKTCADWCSSSGRGHLASVNS